MAHQQHQAYCHLCQRPTLHSRETYDVPHTFHALITLFFLGAWLPVWIIHCLLNLRSSETFLCSVCGQAQGAISPEEASRQADLQRRIKQVAAAGKRLARIEAASRRRRRLRRFMQWLNSAAAASMAATMRAAAAYDRFLQRLSPGGQLLYCFWWILTGASVGAGLAGILIVVVKCF